MLGLTEPANGFFLAFLVPLLESLLESCSGTRLIGVHHLVLREIIQQGEEKYITYPRPDPARTRRPGRGI